MPGFGAEHQRLQMYIVLRPFNLVSQTILPDLPHPFSLTPQTSLFNPRTLCLHWGTNRRCGCLGGPGG